MVRRQFSVQYVMLFKCPESADAERKFGSFSRGAADSAQVLLPKLQESAGIPDQSSVLQHHQDDDGDDDVAAEDGDSKEEVGFYSLRPTTDCFHLFIYLLVY